MEELIKLYRAATADLAIAGLIEGFISPAENVPWQVKWGIGLLTATLFYTYGGLAGRTKPAAGWIRIRRIPPAACQAGGNEAGKPCHLS